MKRRIGPAHFSLVLAGVVFCWPARVQAMTEQELCDLYLGVVEDAVAVFDPIWTDYSEHIPNSGFFDFSKYDTWGPTWYAPEVTVCGNGMVIFCYSVLLLETDRQTFGPAQVPRDVLIDRAIKAIRWCCLTSAYVEHPYPFPLKGGYERRMKGENWIRPFGHRTDVLGWLTVGIARLWHLLDDETRKAVEDVMIGMAPKERFVRTWTWRQGGNHDVVKQDMASTVGAAFLPADPDKRKLYLDIVRATGIDLTSTLHDTACSVVADGKPVREWSRGWNLYQDYSSDHHGWAQIWYGCDMMFEGRYYLEFLSRHVGIPVPETFTYPGNGFDGVLEWIKVLGLPEGEPASVHGMEYDAYYGAGLLPYCYGAVIGKDPVAAAFEERAARRLARHSRAVRLYDYHRNSWAKAAAAWLMHKYRGPRAEPMEFDSAWQSLNGTRHYRWQQALLHHAPDKWVSFSWGPISSQARPRPVAFVVPARGLAVDLEPLVYLHERSLIGEIGFKLAEGEQKSPPGEPIYRFSANDMQCHTAGVVSDPAVDRYYAFWSFADGPCVMWTAFRVKQAGRLSWTGQPVYFYVRPNLTTSRTYVDAQGTHPLEKSAERSSPWWCVNDQLGMAILGGNGRVNLRRTVGNNWARTDAYRDKCDGVYVSALDECDVKPGDRPVDLAAVILGDTSGRQVEHTLQMAGAASKSLSSLPEGWKGLVIPHHACEHRRYLAVANLFGSETQATLNLGFEEGAPLTTREAVVSGGTASLSLTLQGLESFGDVIDLYVEVVEGKWVNGRKLARNRYLLQPVGGDPVRVRLKHSDPRATGVLVSPYPDGATREELDPKDTLTIEIRQPTQIEIVEPDRTDEVSPAVEIADIAIREDNRVTVEVSADDASGIAAVELYCDGEPIDRRLQTPYVWTHRPGEGAHTYRAVATDASSIANRRESFKRTIEVGKLP